MIITPEIIEKLSLVIAEYGLLTPRELAIVLSGIHHGVDLQCNRIQPHFTRLEMMLVEGRAIPVT